MWSFVIADDHPIFRKGLREIIESSEHYKVIAEAESGIKAWQYYKRYQPDIIVLDISMGEVNGLDVAKQILSEDKYALCIMMTMYREEIFCKRAISFGVKGYLLKDDVSETIINCLDTVISRQIFVSESLGDIKRYRKNRRDTDDEEPEKVLSNKEILILEAIAQLKTNKEIAKEQNIAHRTVQNHRQNICNKLNLSGRDALLQFAIKWYERKNI